jgi:hypothetical protein
MTSLDGRCGLIDAPTKAIVLDVCMILRSVASSLRNSLPLLLKDLFVLLIPLSPPPAAGIFKALTTTYDVLAVDVTVVDAKQRRVANRKRIWGMPVRPWQAKRERSFQTRLPLDLAFQNAGLLRYD